MILLGIFFFFLKNIEEVVCGYYRYMSNGFEEDPYSSSLVYFLIIYKVVQMIISSI